MSQAKILIVEDEWITAADLKSLLDARGYQVTGVAPTGEEAIALADRTHPDVILMDIRLKGKIDGFEAAQVIKTEHHLNPAIIFLSAFTAPNLTLLQGKNSFLPKPISGDNLMDLIESMLHSD
jgi:two-component system, response regulator PdtaR